MRISRLPSALALAVVASCGGSDATTPARVVARVTVTGTSTTLNLGQTTTLVAAAFDGSGAPFLNPGATTWSSRLPAVASVDQTGRVLAAGVGSATITASIAGVQGSYTLTVSPAAVVSKDTIFTVGIQFSPNVLSNVAAGSTVVFALGFDGIGHDVSFGAKPGAPAPIPVTTRQNVGRVFSTAGDFPFICPTHPEMTGTITVR